MDSQNTDWRQIVTKNFGKRAAKHTNELRGNICSVDTGIKVSYLVDCLIVKPESAQTFISDLIKGSLVSQSLFIIQFEDCLFISSRDNVKTALDRLQKSLCTVVDVSRWNKTPRLLTESESKDNLGPILDGLVPQLVNDKPGSIVSLHMGDDINRSTVYGVLLGYPVLYWYSDIHTVEHCLQMVELNVVSVTTLQERDFSCVIYSFSYPTTFEESIRDEVASWFKRVECMASAKKIGEIVCKTTKVVLPYVAL